MKQQDRNPYRLQCLLIRRAKIQHRISMCSVALQSNCGFGVLCCFSNPDQLAYLGTYLFLLLLWDTSFFLFPRTHPIWQRWTLKQLVFGQIEHRWAVCRCDKLSAIPFMCFPSVKFELLIMSSVLFEVQKPRGLINNICVLCGGWQKFFIPNWPLSRRHTSWNYKSVSRFSSQESPPPKPLLQHFFLFF